MRNYARAGGASRPALLLIPAQTESWWGYEAAMNLLAERFEVFAVDLRGQGRSSWTPGRYSLDNMGNDLVRFIDEVIGRPTLVSGLSSGGVLAAWLAAYAKPGQLRGACLEDPPLFHAELTPSCGPSIRQGAGPMFAAFNTWLGDQWAIGDWTGLRRHLDEHGTERQRAFLAEAAEPLQNLKEYDPEWGRAFWTGSVSSSCDHGRMLGDVKVPILLTHHFRAIDPETGHLVGALTDGQAARARQLMTEAGQPVEYRSFPTATHFLHAADPELYTRTLMEWVETLASTDAAGSD